MAPGERQEAVAERLDPEGSDSAAIPLCMKKRSAAGRVVADPSGG